jgi:hypothetical protein
MAKFIDKKKEINFIKDKIEADKIIETLDEKLYIIKQELKEKNNEIDEKNKIIEKYKKENIEMKILLHETYDNYNKLKELKIKYKKLKEKI